MKTFLALLLVALLMAGGFWVVQNPGSGVAELRSQGEQTLARLTRGLEAVTGTPATTQTADADTATAPADPPDTDPDTDPTTAGADPSEPAGVDEGARTTAAVDPAVVDELREQLDALAARTATLADRTEALTGRLDSGADESAAVAESSRAALDERLQVLEQQVEATASAVQQAASLDADNRRIAERLDSIEIAQGALVKALSDSAAPASAAAATSADVAAAPDPTPDDTTADDTTADTGAIQVEPGDTVAATESSPASASDASNADEPSASADALALNEDARNVEYKVFFDFNSTEISDEAAGLLNDFIAQEQDRAAAVSIFGLTDRLGPAEYNQALADRRARNVRSYLIQNGFDYTRIQAATGLGEDAAAGVLDDEEEDAAQRAVVLFATQP